MYFISNDDSDQKLGVEGYPMSATLPKPVVQKSASASTGRRRQKKKARFGVVGSYWANLLRRFGTVSSPSLSSSDIRASSADRHSHNGVPGNEVPGDPNLVRWKLKFSVMD
jgi:hypothetical protein